MFEITWIWDHGKAEPSIKKKLKDFSPLSKEAIRNLFFYLLPLGNKQTNKQTKKHIHILWKSESNFQGMHQMGMCIQFHITHVGQDSGGQ